MREILIEMPNYDGRDSDLSTIEALASKYNLEYDALRSPTCVVSDSETKEILLEARALVRCYISGKEDGIKQFLSELENYLTNF